MPHMPQFVLLLARSRHEPEQFVRPAPHVVWHAPAEHTVPAGQTLPHDPQFTLLLVRSRQVPEQLVRPAPHVV